RREYGGPLTSAAVAIGAVATGFVLLAAAHLRQHSAVRSLRTFRKLRLHLRLHAGRADSVTEPRGSVSRYVALHRLPVFLIITDPLAVHACRQDLPQGPDLCQ